MRTIPVLTHYLEMEEKPNVEIVPPIEGISFERAKDLSVEEYRSYYVAVGGPYGWFDRVLMEDDLLRETIEDPGTEVFLLKVHGEFAGYCELDRREEYDVELSFLALKKEFQGKGLGKFLLENALNEAWKDETDRVWVHTCEWDSPVALQMYLKIGFVEYSRDYHDQKVPDDFDISMLES